MEFGIGSRLRERIARLHLVVAQELERAAVNLVGAGLGLRADHAGAGDAEFGVVIRGRDLRFGHRFQRRVDDDPAEHGVVIVGAVEQVRWCRRSSGR